MKQIIATSIEEDAPEGDITSSNLIPPNAIAHAKLHARQSGVLSGTEIIQEVFRQIDPTVIVEVHVTDGQTFSAGDEIATISGNAKSVLQGERIALNFAQRMSGIATLTAAFVHAVAGTSAQILDTRKTTPGLRKFERQAVVHGGGHNHRFSLSDAVLIKDNHLAVLQSAGKGITAELLDLRTKVPTGVTIEVEVDRLDQIEPVLAGNVDIIMLDNFTLEDLRTGVEMINGKAIVEASGGVTLETVRQIADTGVDRISVGSLTHSATAIDLALDVDIEVHVQ